MRHLNFNFANILLFTAINNNNFHGMLDCWCIKNKLSPQVLVFWHECDTSTCCGKFRLEDEWSHHCHSLTADPDTADRSWLSPAHSPHWPLHSKQKENKKSKTLWGFSSSAYWCLHLFLCFFLKEMFYLTSHSTHFILRLYGVGHMVKDHSWKVLKKIHTQGMYKTDLSVQKS